VVRNPRLTGCNRTSVAHPQLMHALDKCRLSHLAGLCALWVNSDRVWEFSVCQASLTMAMDFGRAPRGDPRMPHVSENLFSVFFFAAQTVQLLTWGRGRVLGLTEVRPRKYDRCGCAHQRTAAFRRPNCSSF
jgi:hypothetical protein